MRACIKQRNPKSAFAKKSFRWSRKYKGKDGIYRHLIGCPKGKWSPGKELCKTGTMIYETILFTRRTRCPKGYKVK